MKKSLTARPQGGCRTLCVPTAAFRLLFILLIGMPISGLFAQGTGGCSLDGVTPGLGQSSSSFVRERRCPVDDNNFEQITTSQNLVATDSRRDFCISGDITVNITGPLSQGVEIYIEGGAQVTANLRNASGGPINSSEFYVNDNSSLTINNSGFNSVEVIVSETSTFAISNSSTNSFSISARDAADVDVTNVTTNCFGVEVFPDATLDYTGSYNGNTFAVINQGFSTLNFTGVVVNTMDLYTNTANTLVYNNSGGFNGNVTQANDLVLFNNNAAEFDIDNDPQNYDGSICGLSNELFGSGGGTTEICGDGIDNDFDGLTDEDDPDCQSAINVMNNCPQTGDDIDLDNLFSQRVPDGATLVWSTDGDPSDGVSGIVPSTGNPTGIYYAYFFSSAENCYSDPSRPVDLTIEDCPDCAVTGITPALSTQMLANDCGNDETTVDLTTITASNTPTGGNVSLQFHTVAAPTSGATLVPNPTMVGSGTYYAVFYDAAAVCYSPTTAVTVTITDCCSVEGVTPVLIRN